jgi:fructosamine-3-kinase
MWTAIAQYISQATGNPCPDPVARSVGGGCINQAYQLTSGDRTYFVKLNQAERVAMFEAEALALREMIASHTIRVPQPICWGTLERGTLERASFIVLEWVDLGGRGGDRAWEQMGRDLAALHRWNQPVGTGPGFGWHQTNTIGSTPQPNPWTADWVAFWVEARIGYQLKLARRQGGNFPQGDRLLAAIPDLLANHDPQPSLLHGDLWSGNAAIAADGTPIIFDPAAYWGDREADLAMTELFGGFPPAFYRGYEAVWPLDPGNRDRKTLYNLYHILNHFNLFGGSYGNQANRMIADLL